MKNKIILAMLSMIVAVMSFGCANKEITSYIREKEETKKTDVTIEDEDIPLSQSASQYEESKEAKKAAKEAFELCNTYRKRSGVSVLEWSTGLEVDAKVRAKEACYKWSHIRPNGKEWWTVDSNLMYGENLAKGYFSAEECVNDWMNSKEHRENIEFKDFKKCAIAIYEENGVWYWAEEFGY